MKKTVVIYESKYGSTKRYAEWIAQKLNCPLFEQKKFHPGDFSRYEIILYGGGLYAGNINGLKRFASSLLSQNLSKPLDKKIVLFTCGLAAPDDPDNISSIKASISKVFPAEWMAQIRLFPFRGAIDYSRLSLLHRLMMSMMNKMLLKKEASDRSAGDLEFLECYGKTADFTDPCSISPLVDYVLHA